MLLNMFLYTLLGLFLMLTGIVLILPLASVVILIVVMFKTFPLWAAWLFGSLILMLLVFYD